jgi:flagellar motor switch protein FliN
MADFTPEFLDDVVAACTAGAGEAAGSLGRTLDTELSLAVGGAETLKSDALPDDLNGPGLAILFLVGGAGAVLVLPESTALVPAWCAAPDATGQSKLATMAQELGMNLLPEAFMPEDFKCARVDNIAEALVRGGMIEGAAALSLNLSSPDGKQGVARLIWPLSKPAMMTESATEAVPTKVEAPQPAAAPLSVPPSAPQPQSVPKPARAKPSRQRSLPNYTKSLLKIQVPVVVTLAEKKQPLAQILEMGPGMIIQFEKSCEETLQLEVGEYKIAAGEAIKVGDKFGLRVTSIILPEERFSPVGSRARS